MTTTAAPQKTAETENFPVASLMLSAKIRPQVMAFYRIARQADDIADSPILTKEEKIRQLEGIRDNLPKDERATLYLQDLIKAFIWDAEERRYETWDELLEYCAYSAAPVGQFLLDLHGELNDRTLPASNALCAALQITNHLQDCGADYKALRRVYIPYSWLEEAGLTIGVLDKNQSPQAFRTILDRALAKTDQLITEASPLPRRIKSWGLRIQAHATLQAARTLADKLRHEDPLERRVELTFSHKLTCAMQGMVKVWFQG